MPLFIEINETQTANYTMLSKRARDRVLKGVFHAIGMKWQKDMLPNHFTLAAKEKYGYRERTNKYKRRKLRAGHGITPLVYTGLLKRSLTGFMQRVMAYPTRATIRLVGPSYLTINYKPGRPHLAREILTVAQDEREELTQHGHDVMFKLLEEEAKAAAKRKRYK
jgi:hypothetical protein